MTILSSEKTFGFNTNRLKFWTKRRSLTISDHDPVYKVIYLGNVMTLWAKGDGAIDKPLATLWKNYCAAVKNDMYMKLTICNSGLKAITRGYGLTEYWANRITYAGTHPNHPKVFCWIYRHEGRKMKYELRCHAVLCIKENKAKEMATNLNQRLATALQEFRREKRYRENVRLSLASSCQDLPLIPLRKQLLNKGLANFRQPLERSKSAPKLHAIEEIIEEPEEEEVEEEEEEDEIEDNRIFDDDSTNMYGSVSSEGQGSLCGEVDSLSDNFNSLELTFTSSYPISIDQQCDEDFIVVEDCPNPCQKLTKLKCIQEHKAEDTISDESAESGYSESDRDLGSRSSSLASSCTTPTSSISTSTINTATIISSLATVADEKNQSSTSSLNKSSAITTTTLTSSTVSTIS